MKRVYKESEVPPKTRTKLGESILEWETSKKKLLGLRESLKKLVLQLSRMESVIAKAQKGAKNKLDEDITESYSIMMGDLQEQRDGLQALVIEMKAEIATREERMAMIAVFFEGIPEQAEVYVGYDKFSAEAMELQKELKE